MTGKTFKTRAGLAVAAVVAAAAAHAGPPVRWNVDVESVRPFQTAAYHGETLGLEARFYCGGQPFDAAASGGGAPWTLFWQTNGMDSAYWTAPATAASNKVSAVFAADMDPGAPLVYGFLGQTGQNYRASFAIRFAASPGAAPNAISPPVKTLDFATIEVENAPWATQGDLDDLADGFSDAIADAYDAIGRQSTRITTLDGKIAAAAAAATNYTDSAVAAAGGVTPSMVTNIVNDIAPTPGDYANVSNRAVNALSRKEAEAGFTEWVYQPAVVDNKAVSIAFSDGEWVLCLDGERTEVRVSGSEDDECVVLPLADEILATRTRLPTMADLAGKASTNDVALSPVYSFSEWVIDATGTPYAGTDLRISWANDEWSLFSDNSFIDPPQGGDKNATSLHFNVQGVTATRTRFVIGYTLGDQTNSVVASTNAVATAASDLRDGIAAAAAAATNHTDSAVSNITAVVSTWEGFLDGSNVVFSITNYLSGAYNLDAAKLRILELRDGEYREVYNSRDEILLHVADATGQVFTAVNAAIVGKADKDWGKYTSSGGEAPSNTVYMTAPNTVFAGGLEYERVAVGQGAICVLTTKGAPTWTQGDEGTFKFQDDGGTNYFGFAKTDSYTIGANTDGITVSGGLVTLTYNVTMSGRPCVWYKSSLSTAAWEQLNTPDGAAVPGASHAVTWEADPPANTQVCYINVSGQAQGFFKATIEVAGEAKFMTNMRADLSGGIMCTNTATGVMGVIKPTYNGSAVSWAWSVD